MLTNENADSCRLGTRLDNWRTGPWNRWSFHNVRQLLPTATIHRGPVTAPLARKPTDLSALECKDRDGASRTYDEVLRAAFTDAIVVVHKGAIVEERYFNGMQPRDPHILMSVSKSVTAVLAGILMERGLLAADRLVEDYLPEAAASGFAGATIQQVLDMRVGLDFDEDYYVMNEGMRHYREAAGWNPVTLESPPSGLHEFLLSCTSDRPHGGPFQYTSPNSDLLGWIIERVTGRSLAQAMSEHLWEPLGAEFDGYVTIDRAGGARAAGGINLCARDLARLGLAMLQQGNTGAAAQVVIPASWIADTTKGGDAQAWAEGNFAHLLPGGCYRNKWYQYGNDLGAYCGIGIHGQFLYVAPAAGVVIAHFASHPEPFNPQAETMCLDALDSIARYIGA